MKMGDVKGTGTEKGLRRGVKELTPNREGEGVKWEERKEKQAMEMQRNEMV